MTDGQYQRLGAYVETSAAGERVRAYVPAPLPPKPALELGRFMRVYERAIAAVGRLDGGDHDATLDALVSLHVRPQGSPPVLADRGHAILAVGPPAVRKSRGADGRTRRRDRGVQLRRGDRAWRLSDAGRISPIAPADPRDARHPAQVGAGRCKATGRVPPLAELDRRNPAWKRSVRAAAARTGWTNAWMRWSASYTARIRHCPRSSGRAWPTSSSRRSIPFSTADGRLGPAAHHADPV